MKMRKTMTQIDIDNNKRVKEYKQKFLEQLSFQPFRGVSDSQKDFKPAFRYTASLIFIRAKFLFLGILDELENKNAFAAYAILKAYWETVATMGYFKLAIEKRITAKEYDDIVLLSRKIAMGGKKYPTEDMVRNKGDILEDFLQPNILTMMQKIDKDLTKIPGVHLGKEVFSEEYNLFIAEAGHPTFLGFFPGGRKLADGTLLPDINRAGADEDEKTIMNYLVLSSAIFFYYWEKCKKLE